MMKMATVLYLYEDAVDMLRRLQGMQSAARALGWHIEPVDMSGRVQSFGKMLNFWQPDGLIITGALARHKVFQVRSALRIPVVWCDADKSILRNQYSCVSHDPKMAIRKIAGELIGLDLDAYAYVNWCEHRDWSFARGAILRHEAERAGKAFFSFEVCKRGRNFCLVDYLERLQSFLVGLPRPCGVLGANDATAAHVLRIARSSGIVVPDEMAVAGIDNDEFICENTDPSLTSIALDCERSGRLAVELLAKRMANPSAPHEIVPYGSTDVVRRQSTRRFVQKDVRVVKAIEYIRLNACKGIGVADVVREMGLHPRIAEMRFKKIAGHSMRDEILSVRIARGKELLANPHNSIDSVAVACGYSDSRALRYAFRKKLGVPLRSCRRR